jgi:hypothetical protein
MIALLAAAVVANAAPDPRFLTFNAGPVGRLEVFAGTAEVCDKAARTEKAAAERAILRDSDKRAQAKRLTDLPRAYMCHAGGAQKEAGK